MGRRWRVCLPLDHDFGCPGGAEWGALARGKPYNWRISFEE